jgi:outer membrane protein assembly factor BamB
MKSLLPAVFILAIFVTSPAMPADWSQWGGNARHTGQAAVAGQPLTARLADVVYDPFVAQEVNDGNGDLFVHYQTPLIDGNDVFIEFKSGTYSSSSWVTQIWGVRKLSWIGGRLMKQWEATSDWKPEPRGGVFFEPVFHAALRADALFMPAAGGAVLEIDRATGLTIRTIAPLPASQNTFVAGPVVVDPSGNVYYDAIQLNASNPYGSDVVDSWLVKIDTGGQTTKASFRTLVPGAPLASDNCLTTFSTTELPWPPSRDAVPPTAPCGSQRAGINIAPAIGADGTVFTVTRAHLNSRYSYMVAVNPDLTLKWSASMRDRLKDGCDVLLPPSGNGLNGGCRQGARSGVDPADNTPGAGRVDDDSSSCPVVAPDGSVLYGAFTSYNYEQGHLMHFSATGEFLGAYRFGWDITPAIYEHDGTYSVITKENHYPVGSYCSDPQFCSTSRNADDPVGYFITQLDPQFNPEWQFRSTNTLSCRRDDSGNVACHSDHPIGFEWCVNGPAVDARGVVYANSEDGNVYAIGQGGLAIETIFLQLALGAAYTPVSVGPDGRIYTQNAGHLFVVGSANGLPVPERRRAARH